MIKLNAELKFHDIDITNNNLLDELYSNIIELKPKDIVYHTLLSPNAMICATTKNIVDGNFITYSSLAISAKSLKIITNEYCRDELTNIVSIANKYCRDLNHTNVYWYEIYAETDYIVVKIATS